jgi:ABC-type enterochelin transport system ATPase subunit
MKSGEIVSQGPAPDVLTAKHLTESYETPIDVLFDTPRNRLFIYT